MNTGQTLLTVGAMVLLGYTVLTTNRTNLTHGVILQQTEIGVYMISLAISRIEEASGKAFDAATADDMLSGIDPSPLTATGSFGPASGENYPNFNDFDDFHNFVKVDTIPSVGVLKVQSFVRYINPTNPDSILSSSTKTFHKRMDVEVINVSSRDTAAYQPSDTLRMSHIFSYWAFR